MGKTIFKYRCYCVTEQAFKTTWSDTKITTCPDNNTHTIDDDSVLILEHISQDVVQIQNDLNNTKGNYLLDGLTINVPAQSNSLTIKSFPMPISCYAVYCYPTQSNVDDKINCYFTLPTVPLMSNVSVGDSNFYVPSPYIMNAQTAFNVYLYNGSNTEALGKVLSINTSNNSILTEYAASNTYTTSNFLKTRGYFVRDVMFPFQEKYIIGQGTLNGTYIPANFPIFIEYDNHDCLEKKMTFHLEYTY